MDVHRMRAPWLGAGRAVLAAMAVVRRLLAADVEAVLAVLPEDDDAIDELLEMLRAVVVREHPPAAVAGAGP